MAMEIDREEWAELAEQDRQAELVGALLTWHIRCGAGCRGRVHSEIVWVSFPEEQEPGGDEELALALAATLRANFGADFLACAPAPGATRDPAHHQSTTAVGIRAAPFGATVEAETEATVVGGQTEPTPYRVAFRSPVRIRTIRRAFLRANPEGAAALGYVDEGGDDDER